MIVHDERFVVYSRHRRYCEVVPEVLLLPDVSSSALLAALGGGLGFSEPPTVTFGLENAEMKGSVTLRGSAATASVAVVERSDVPCKLKSNPRIATILEPVRAQLADDKDGVLTQTDPFMPK